MKSLKAGNTTTDIFKHTSIIFLIYQTCRTLEQLDKKQILLQPCNIQRSTLHLTGCDEKFRTHQQMYSVSKKQICKKHINRCVLLVKNIKILLTVRLLVKSDYFTNSAVPKSLQMDITCTGHFVLIYCVT